MKRERLNTKSIDHNMRSMSHRGHIPHNLASEAIWAYTSAYRIIWFSSFESNANSLRFYSYRFFLSWFGACLCECMVSALFLVVVCLLSHGYTHKTYAIWYQQHTGAGPHQCNARIHIRQRERVRLAYTIRNGEHTHTHGRFVHMRYEPNAPFLVHAKLLEW